MTRADGSDPTAAARQARRRARLQAQGDAQDVTLRAVLAAVLELGRKVDNLAESVGIRDVTPGRVRSRPEGAHARTRVRGEAPAPTGPGGLYSDVTPSRVTPWGQELEAIVLDALQGRGANSAHAIRDHLGATGLEVTLAPIVAALVQLRGQGRVLREEGDAVLGKPDTWRAVEGALASLELGLDRVRVTPAPDVHVTCQDYHAHQGLHRWDDALGAFVCPACTAPEAATVTHGGHVNGHA